MAVLSPREHSVARAIRPPERGLPSQAASLPAKTAADLQKKTSLLNATIDSSVSLSAISRTIEPSLQSSFHLSLTVLVRYRSLANI